MTEQIKILESFKETFSGADNINTIDTAINSLKAWEEVMKDLEKQIEFDNELGQTEVVVGLRIAINIINQKLAKIEE